MPPLRVTALALILSACASAPPPAPASPAPAPPPPAAPTTVTAAPAPAPDADDPALDDAERAYLDLLVSTSPEAATGLGIHTRDTEIDDYTLAGFEDHVKQTEAMLASVRARFATPHLSLAKQIDLELLESSLEVSIRRSREEKSLVRDPQTYEGVLGTIFAMVARPYAPAPERARAIVARLEKVPGALALAKKNLDDPPRVWTEVAIESAAEVPSFLEEVRAFLEPALDKDPAVAHALGVARAAFAEYAAFLKKDLLPRSNGDFAIGRASFDFLLHRSDFLDEDTDGVLALGKKVFDETEAQLTALASKIDPKTKGWPELAKRLKNKHPTAEQLLPEFRAQLARARAFVVQKDIVTLPPDDECVVMETPPFERATDTASYDGAPPFDTQTTKGIFFVTPADATLKPAQREELLREDYDAEQASTVVHETYPGHHVQMSLARRYPSLIRKIDQTDLFAEGWALYCEELLFELGYYTDEERFVQLEWTLVRAARVLIDVGIQTQGMTFDQAVAILTDKVHLERTLARSEVKRYTSSPTQPLSYLVGREKILALRSALQRDEGAAFSLKKFHDALLSHGSIPLKLVAEEMAGTR